MEYKRNKEIVPLANALRKNMTKEERHLWYDYLREYPDTKEEIQKINKELKELRKDVRMCVNILADSELISKNLEQLKILEQEAKMPNKPKKNYEKR